MATVTLDTVIISLASDLTKTVSLEVTSLEDDPGMVGEVRRYANGRRRLVTRAGGTRTLSVKFDTASDRTVLTTLQGWAGKTVLFRDPFGRKVWGVFVRLPTSERVPVNWPEASLVLEEITYSEAV